MPEQTLTAINWAIQQFVNGMQVTSDMPSEIVDKVREYFNEHGIIYSTFSYDDLIPFLVSLSE